MRVLIACEESQTECMAFRALGCSADYLLGLSNDPKSYDRRA